MPKTTRFVRIAQSAGSDKFLHVQQVQVYVEGTNKNVALASEGATASTSSSGWQGKPEYAIDGNVDENQAWPNSCHSQGQGNSEWWVVDLKRDFVVVKVVVYNRPKTTAHNQNRLSGARVLLQHDASDAGTEIGVLTSAREQEFLTKSYPVPAYEGLVLPYNTGATDDNANDAVNGIVNPFLGKCKAIWEQEIITKGGLKSDLTSLDLLKQLVIKEVRGLADMPKEYKHFGSDDFASLLCVILETNPFFTASLTPRSGGGFELVSYDPIPDKGDRKKRAKTDRDPSNAPYNVKVMRAMPRPGPQVNFRFTVKPEGGLAIDGYDVFDNGVKLAQPDESKPHGGSPSPLQYFASAALYDLFYVAQTYHGSIHVFHYVLTNALKYASEDYTHLNDWAVEYNSNVNSKYNAVSSVLIPGWGAAAPVMRANIEAWGRCSTAEQFQDHWFQSPRKDLEAAGLCSEFFKHACLGTACSISTSAALETADSSKLATTNQKLQEYIGASGAWAPEDNAIKTVRSLVDLMLVTGVIHGGTLSMTRLLNKPQFLRWGNIEEKSWGPNDAGTSIIGLSTIQGVQDHKHAAGSKAGGVGNSDITYGPLQEALGVYDLQAQRLQKAYEAQIIQRADFNDVGFLLTDYCTEYFDGKQLTLATYI